MPLENTDIVEAVRNRILEDTYLTSRLATYEFTTGVASPAVFTTDVVPQDCSNPAVLITRDGGSFYGTRGRKGHESVVIIHVRGDRTRAHDELRRTAFFLRRLLNRAGLEVTDGYRAFRCIADPPATAPDPDGFPGYAITVRVLQLADQVDPEPEIQAIWGYPGAKWDAGLKWG
jgi:hypothetical protein